jgi:prepilin-type N-terminal cleavage/methylation domain-containing protein
MRDTLHSQDGFTLVELIVTITVLGIIFAVLTDTFVLGLRTTADTETKLAQSNAQQFGALWLTKDIRSAATATPNGAACGFSNAPLVVTRASSPTAAPDRAVVWTIASNQLSRSTCPIAASSPTTSDVIAEGVSSFVAGCAPPGPCGTVHLDVTAAASAYTPSYHFTLDVGRRQQ